jgi:hypothetical protein
VPPQLAPLAEHTVVVEERQEQVPHIERAGISLGVPAYGRVVFVLFCLLCLFLCVDFASTPNQVVSVFSCILLEQFKNCRRMPHRLKTRLIEAS